jgi:hypothetical protein
MTKQEIQSLIKEYNSKLLPGDKRLILEDHDFLCRCTTCWYEYDGPKRDNLYCPKVNPWEDYPNEEMTRRVAEARVLEIKKRTSF